MKYKYKKKKRKKKYAQKYVQKNYDLLLEKRKGNGEKKSSSD